MSRIAVGFKDGRTIWQDDPSYTHAHLHVSVRATRGVYGELVTGGEGQHARELRLDREREARKRVEA